MGEWVVLELGPKAEGEDPDIVTRSIRTTLRSDVEVFIPAAVTTVGDDKVVRYLVEGYGFVRKSLPDLTYLKLENTKYVNTVLTTMKGSIRSVSSVPDREIERMRSQVRVESEQGIGVGDTILITSGAYRQLTAVVIEDIHEHDTVQVFIKLRSKETIVSLPRNFLKLIQKAERPAFQAKGDELLGWLRQARPIFLWEEQAVTRLVAHRDEYTRLSRWVDEQRTLTDYLKSFEPVAFDAAIYANRAQDLVRIADWLDRMQTLVQIVKVLDRPTPDVESLVTKQKKLQLVTKMDDGVQHLLPIYRASMATLDRTSLETKYMNLAWVADAVTQLRVIGEEVSSIEQAIPSATIDIGFEDVPPKTAAYTGPDVQNVIIDGLNLAIRCLFAPGLGELRDSNGRPTGVYIGFLRSLGSLVKRWPTARIHVCWDGSSKRRKEAFPGYKADRPALPLRMEEVEWLREALPKFGVFQSWNRGEEADDAIATLVKSTFANQQNVFMSTDKDLFQLVSDTDIFLYPAVGKARETLYNPAGVTEKWGVPPEKLVTLRAMLGDTSDRIPGVPGVPQKVLVNLVRSYGTVDKIFASNLAGLSKLQYEKLIGSEAIIRRNVDLMTLRLNVPLETIKPESDRTAAEKRLLDVDAKPDPILAAFFERPANGV